MYVLSVFSTLWPVLNITFHLLGKPRLGMHLCLVCMQSWIWSPPLNKQATGVLNSYLSRCCGQIPDKQQIKGVCI